MLKLTIWEIFLRAIPEGIIFMFAMFVISNTVMNKKNLLLSSLISGISVYLVRLLPIHFGFHTFISLFMIIIISKYINKIDTIKAISSALITIISLWICELINIMLLTMVLKIDLQKLVNPFIKTVLGLPSLILFGAIILVIHITATKRKVTQGVSN